MNISALSTVFVVAFAHSVHAADFQNLDLEAANLPYVPIDQGYPLPTSQAFPGWTAYLGTMPVNQVLYNIVTFGGATVTLIQFPSPYIQGVYGALLVPGFDERIMGFVGVSLAQTGLIPSDAKSVLFYADPVGAPFSDVGVSLNGQDIPLFPVANNGDITLFGGDVSAFAGSTAELRFTIDYGDGHALIDGISFSPLPIPEPSSWVLLGGGLLCLAGFIRKHARR